VSDAEDYLAFQLRVLNIHAEREYRFDPVRKWRFDFALLEERIAIEVEGGTWQGGRHTRGTGFEADCEKYNSAVLQGWRLLRFTPKMIEEGTPMKVLEEILGK